MVKKKKFKSYLIFIISLLFFNINVLAISSDEKIEVSLIKCIDGDTAKFKINDKEETVRFLAIDTPESVHANKKVEEYGKEASNYTCNLLNNASKITLEFDSNSDKYDKYDRLLAYVYADNKMIQKSLLEVGYAKVAYLYDDYKYTKDLLKIEEKAKNDKLGIWSNDVYQYMADSNKENLKENDKENDKIWDTIIDFIIKIVSKLLEYLENVL